MKNVSGTVITVGRDPACSYSAGSITYDELARPSFELYENGVSKRYHKPWRTGESIMYTTLSRRLRPPSQPGVSMEAVKRGLLNFTGTKRRFEKKGEFNGVTVIDDYAHHPQEIQATLKTAGNYPHNQAVVRVPAPHLHQDKSLFR